MKTKYVCHDLFSLYVNFHNNRTMWSTNLLVKICRWGGGRGLGKRAKISLYICLFTLIEVTEVISTVQVKQSSVLYQSKISISLCFHLTKKLNRKILPVLF